MGQICEELKGNNQKGGNAEKLQAKLAPMKSGETRLPSHDFEDAHQNSAGPYKGIVYRIKLLEKTGKFEKHDCLVNSQLSCTVAPKFKLS